MTFPKAYRGVKKIFAAEILNLAASLCIFLTGLAAVTGLAAAVNNDETGLAVSGIGVLVLVAAAVVLPVIGYIMSFAGMHQASDDEGSFGTAFWFAVLALIVSLISGLMMLFHIEESIGDAVTDLVRNICEICIFVFVIQGISSLAGRLCKEGTADFGNRVRYLVTILYGLVTIADLVPAFFGESETADMVSGVMNITAGILSTATHIIYLVYLGKAKTLLKKL